MKAAPLVAALKHSKMFDQRLIHTGQHFDSNMSEIFFGELGLPRPDVFLNVNSVSANNQIAHVILGLERDFQKNQPHLVVIFGDVNSTLAAAIAANKANLLLAHVEAGLRSFDRQMPEEHNRILADLLSDFLFVPSEEAKQNLLNEGVSRERIFFVGNIMVDSLFQFIEQAKARKMVDELGLVNQEYALVTLHRPSNVDLLNDLSNIFSALMQIGKQLPVIFPIHPRTKLQLDKSGLETELAANGVRLINPIGYLDFLNLTVNARVVLTDSGGIQEETTALGVPCLTLRKNTERPITISQGTNKLAGVRTNEILSAFHEVLNQPKKKPKMPELWDGRTAERILGVLERKLLR